MVTLASTALSKRIGDDKKLRRRLAHRCDVSEQAVRYWASGACAPLERQRPLIEEETGIPVGDWAVPAKGTRRKAAA